jgi:hypothetical protein
MQDGCKVYMDSYIGIEWIMFHGHLDYFQKPLFGVGLAQTGDHGTPNSHANKKNKFVWFILYYHVWGPT